MEYRTKIEEMRDLISKNKFVDAMNVAETINWRKVHNINDLIAGSECYEAAGQIEEARDLLFVAHERSPIGRMILYKLCMISIKLKEIDEAQEYYNEFVQIAPHDSLKYILKYNINIAKGADNATLIKILEQLKENDFIEEWAYELAYLYHKTNQGDKCIALCDEIILWFGDGPVVERALELKMLYQPLDKSQEDKYRNLQQKKDGITEITTNSATDSSSIVPNVKPIKLPDGPERFDTINLQAEIKKNIDEIMKATDTGEVSENIGAIKNLVEEIPYLKVPEEAPEEEPEKFSVNDTFQQYLEEGFDGQISLKLADESIEREEQVEGQMTIEDVLAEWEKTKRAAEAAMEDAKSKELESARSKALREANNVLNRLEGAMSKLDAGMTSQDLLKEEYLGSTDEITTENKPVYPVIPDEILEKDSADIISEEIDLDETLPEDTVIEESDLQSDESTEVDDNVEEIAAEFLEEELEDLSVETAGETTDLEEIEAEESLEEKLEENLQNILEDEEEIKESQEAPEIEEEHTGFTIPKLSTDGSQKGLVDIPVVSAEGAAMATAASVPTAIMHTAGELMEATPSWQPPTLNENDSEETEEVDFKEASQMIADVNSFLQQEIDRLTGASSSEELIKPTITEPVFEAQKEETIANPVCEQPTIELPVIERANIPVEPELTNLKDEFMTPVEEPVVPKEEPQQHAYVEPIIQEPVVQEPVIQEPIIQEPVIQEPVIQEPVVQEPQISIDDIELPPIEIPEELFQEPKQENFVQPEPIVAPEVPPVQVERVQIEEPKVAPVKVQNSTPKPAKKLDIDDEDLAVFSYFLPINGMKSNIVQVIEGAASYLGQPKVNGGSIAIVGESGSGKTQMATSIIKVLQKKTGYPKGGIGKIAGEKLNEKDIQKLYSKIQGGCLIIETAGGISKETAVTLSLLMEQDDKGTIIIIEDNKKGIDKALIKDSSFAKRFTEKVVIPVFSIDELVSFAKTYALEAGCTIDDMGILALYNRINLIGRYDHVTTIKEVAEIMDDAIEKSTKGGFFNKPKYDKNGNVILKEKDFDK